MNPDTPSYSLLSLVFLFGAGQGFFLVLALLSLPGRNQRANRLLASITLVFSITLIDGYLHISQLFISYPNLIATIWPTNFLYGPLLLLYVRELVSHSHKGFHLRTLGHFFPFFIAIALSIPFYLLSTDEKILGLYGDLESAILSNADQGNLRLLWAAVGISVNQLAAAVQIGIYLIAVFVLLHRHTQRIKAEYSNLDKISLRWLRNLLIGLTILWVLFLFTTFYADDRNTEEDAIFVIHFATALLIFLMSYFGMRQSRIFFDSGGPRLTQGGDSASDESFDVTVESKFEGGKYSRSGLTADKGRELQEKLLGFMQKNKPYLDNHLTLSALAGLLHEQPHHISQVINERIGTNFFEFVNRYRIEEAKQRIMENTNTKLNVFAIAMDSGFSSKSAFYTAFKKVTAMTPYEYRNAAAQSNSS